MLIFLVFYHISEGNVLQHHLDLDRLHKKGCYLKLEHLFLTPHYIHLLLLTAKYIFLMFTCNSVFFQSDITTIAQVFLLLLQQ